MQAFIPQGLEVSVGRTVIGIAAPDKQARQTIAASDRLGRLVGASVVMRRLFADIVRVAARDMPVLILGETGTG